MRISVLGMGRMGVALATRLAAGDHQVTVWNRSAGKAGPALEAGAAEAPSIEQAVAGAEVVITMLAADDAVRAVALGAGGIAEFLPAGALYVDSSTVSTAVSGELAERFADFVAMPVLGSPDAVRAGTAVYLAGGPGPALDRLGPVTGTLTDKLTRLGQARLAVAAKVTANFLLLGGLTILAEALEVGRAGGLDDDTLRSLFAESPLVAPALRNRFDNVLNRSGEGWFSLALGAKDVGLAASQAGGALPVAAAVLERFEGAAAGPLADADVAAIGRTYQA